MDRVHPVLLVTGGLFSLNFGAALARSHFDTVGPLGATFLRLLFAAVILLLLFRPRMWLWSRQTWAAVAILGVALGAMNQLIYLSFAYLPIGVAITIEYLGPLTLALIHIRRWSDAIWPALALGGVALIGLGATAHLSLVGIGFAVAAAVCWAGYILASARLGRLMPDTSGLAMAMVVAMLLAVPLGLPQAVGVFDEPVLLWVFLLIAIMSSAIPYSLELRALRRMPTRVFGILQSMGPGAGAIAGLVILGQALRWQELVALLLVTAASVGISVTTPQRQPVPVIGD
ncbi:MAG: EamA family transporter [Burkholderiaceae bacterium]|nr:EamA family transporter [Microbacteriaceae bacterium]